MFHNDENEHFYDIVLVTDFSLVSIAVEKIKSTLREKLPEAVYFIWKRKLIESSTKRHYLE